MTGPGEAGGPMPLNLSEVGKLNGVGVDVLRLLISDDLVPGVVRGPRGHVKVRSDAVLTFAQVSELLRDHVVRLLRRAHEQVTRVEVEIEAVRNDIDEALLDPMAPLGHDLTTLRTTSYDRTASTITSALSRLELTANEIQRYQAALSQTSDVTPSQAD